MASYSSRVIVSFIRSTTDMLLKNNNNNNRRLLTFTTSLVSSSSSHKTRNYTVKSSTTLDPPHVSRLAHTARITITPQEVEEFGPKIQKVVDWFGQLQAVDLESIEPAIRSDIDGDNLREDVPVNFENKEAIIAAIPSYDEPYIKVPKVLNKE